MIKDGDGDDGVDDVHRTLTEVRGPVEVYEVRSVTAQQGESLSTSTRPAGCDCKTCSMLVWTSAL